MEKNAITMKPLTENSMKIITIKVANSFILQDKQPHKHLNYCHKADDTRDVINKWDHSFLRKNLPIFQIQTSMKKVNTNIEWSR